MAKAFDFETVERGDLQVSRFVAGFAPCDQLGDHRVVEHRHFAAIIDAVINADAFDTATTVSVLVLSPASDWRAIARQAAC